MLASYHLMFTVLSIVLFFIGILFLFLWAKKYEYGTLIGLIFLLFDITICWISRLGFHGVQVIGLDSTNTFQVYTYSEMWALNMLPYGIILISLAIIIVVVLMQFGVLYSEATKDDTEVRLPTSDRAYWKKR